MRPVKGHRHCQMAYEMRDVGVPLSSDRLYVCAEEAQEG